MRIVTGAHDAEVGRLVDSTSTRPPLGRWRQELSEEIANFNRSVMEGLRSKFIALGAEAVATIAEIMNDPSAPAPSLLRAAESILEHIGLGEQITTEPLQPKEEVTPQYAAKIMRGLFGDVGPRDVGSAIHLPAESDG